MTDIEIPYEKDRHGWYRFFEILPGALSWLILFMPLILSFINVTAATIFILAYVFIYFLRTIAVDIRALTGYRTVHAHARLNWGALNKEIEAGEVLATQTTRPKWHYANLKRLAGQDLLVKPSELTHAVIIATYNESLEVLEPTIKSVADSDYDTKRVILILAYEERGGPEVEERAKNLIDKYKKKFMFAKAVKHPKNIPGEIIGKGGNITFAGRYLQKYLEDNEIDPLKVVVTTLDSDNRPDKKYLAALTYLYCVSPDPEHVSYQPLPMYTNNIWDVPAPMRVIAAGNNFFYIMLTQRPHRERNFSAHAQCMKALIETDFWSVRTVVEDGHQFWRSYFRFDGNYQVYPVSVPIYQDAVLSKGYFKTFKAQFIQLRRWTYGASDIAYVAYTGFFKKNKVPKRDLLAKFLILLESHVTWATGAILLLIAGFEPALVNPQSYAANELPLLISRIQTIGLIGLLASLFVALKTLPPRPDRYKKRRNILMLLQWIYFPVTTIAFGSVAAFNSQTRLIFKKYLSKFDVTEKAVVSLPDEVKKDSMPVL